MKEQQIKDGTIAGREVKQRRVWFVYLMMILQEARVTVEFFRVNSDFPRMGGRRVLSHFRRRGSWCKIIKVNAVLGGN